MPREAAFADAALRRYAITFIFRCSFDVRLFTSDIFRYDDAA